MTPTPTTAAWVSGTIKALDWKANGLRHATALGFNSTYTITLMPDGSGARWQSRYMGEWFDAADSEAAKAAAQADYEVRILAAIQPDPEPQPVATSSNPEHVATPSSAGTVSVEAAAQIARDCAQSYERTGNHAKSEACLFVAKQIAALLALANGSGN